MSPRPIIRITLFLLAGAVTAAFGPGRGRAETIAPPAEFLEVQETISAMVQSGDLPSMAVAVARDGKVVWMEGIGWADKDRQIAANPDTVYAIGSTSKSMTATLAMALSERGLIDLDLPVIEYLDQDAAKLFVAEVDNYPNLRELLSMTAGIPHGGGVLGIPEYTLSRDEMFLRSAVGAYPPGSLYEYSNYSIGAAMYVMEKATGQTFASLMEDYVFHPLGMNNSSVSYLTGADNQAVLYDNNLKTVPYYRFYPEAAGGFYSSAADMMRFALFHAGLLQPDRPVVSPEGLDLMHSDLPHDLPGALSRIGWGRLELPSLNAKMLISNGNVIGGNAHVSLLGEDGDIIITATNMTSYDSIADVIAFTIGEILLPGLQREFFGQLSAYEAEESSLFSGDPLWTGTWQGRIEAHDLVKPVELVIDGNSVSISVDESNTVAVQDLHYPFGTITGTITGLQFGIAGRGSVDKTAQMRLALRGDSIYGHVILQISDGDMRGYYPYRMRLTRVR